MDTYSLNTESVYSNKQNHFHEQIMHAKPYPQNSIIPSHQHHFTLEHKKPSIEHIKHNTTIGLQSQNQSKSIDKQAYNDLNEENITHLSQQQPISKEPHFDILNKQNQCNPIIHSTQYKKYSIRPALPRIKRRPENNIIEKQTTSSQIKFDYLESDVRLHVPHLNAFSETSQQHQHNLHEVFSLCPHVMKPIKKNFSINHVFNRHLSCLCSQPVAFLLPTNTDQVLYSKKVNRFLYSEFKILFNKRGEQYQLGTLKSNFLGSVYNFYPKDIDDIYFSISFTSKKYNPLHDFRYSEIYVNKQLYSPTNHHQSHFNKNVSLQDRYTLNNKFSQANPISKFKSQMPMWSQQHKAYGLNFRVQSIFPSAKNTIFVDEEDKQVMEFYKNSHLTYDISFENPFSWILAYGYALATTDFKIVTQ